MSHQAEELPPEIGRTGALIFGIISYAVHWLAFIYMMGFLANVFVWKSVDFGTVFSAKYPTRLIVNIIVLALFGVLHWLMARQWFKDWWTRLVPTVIERSTFVLTSSILLGVLFLAWSPVPDVIWEVANPSLARTIIVIYWGGWALAIYATFPINHWDLFGVRQVWLYFRGIPYTEGDGYGSIVYKILPHPIFIGYAIVVWSTPRMTAGHLLLAVLVSIFLLLDVWFTDVWTNVSPSSK
jgi:protein-S-isoprenylcysteine O-methyltransferase Ste14